MILLIGFAFLAGVVTVLSPCILPVLPVVLSGGVAGGKARPWGVITGFILSFSVFTLALSTIVQALGLNPDILRWIAAGLITLFGVVLVVPALKDGFLLIATRLTQRSTTVALPGKKSAAGYWSGLTLGLGLGIVWTPCVGPIMASVITLALTQRVDAGSVVLTIAYSLGTAVPLLLIMLGGRGLLNRLPWLTKNSSGIQRGFGVLMIVTAAALFTGADRAFSTWLLETFPNYGAGLTSIENQKSVKSQLDQRQASLALPVSSSSDAVDPLTLGQGDWFNSPPLTLSGLKGKVVLVDFWTYSCINCVRTLPYLRDWYKKYHNQGLEIVGVHSPEFAFERSSKNVGRAIHDLRVTWPVVQDNALKIWQAYHNEYWPAHYLYDRTGKLIETHFGEGAYAETEAKIAQALGVSERPTTNDASLLSADRTPETYLGYQRGRRFASPEAVMKDVSSLYSASSSLKADQWALEGRWTIGPEYSETTTAKASLLLHFRGKNVYLVLNPASGVPVPVKVYRNGSLSQTFEADTDRLYTLWEGKAAADGELKVEFGAPVRVYALTFG